MTIKLRTIKSEKNSNDSEYGAWYAFLTVGAKPKTSTVVSVITAHNGSDVKYQKGKEDIARIKNTQSVLVIVISDLFIYASNAISRVIIPEMPIGHAPAPPLSSSCARKTTKVVEPQITQEKTCGFICPCMIERM